MLKFATSDSFCGDPSFFCLLNSKGITDRRTEKPGSMLACLQLSNVRGWGQLEKESAKVERAEEGAQDRSNSHFDHDVRF